MKKHVEVVAGILQYQDRFLAVQRAESPLSYVSQKWEFPGGKVEQGESLIEALKRELQEELTITIDHADFLLTIEHRYPDFDITLHCFLCQLNTPDIDLNVHIDQRWLQRDQLFSVDWAEADIPAVDRLHFVIDNKVGG
ncbi:(deoxy)nucleoside triphosphate pyrophosphohydrolase [Vibrio sp. SS-MA-C1-2]|uniref:(deoxy)nucleoside triphosphate pyrophosphohydrolase n=1 Tax=Vibrio sp. SS-MA-C1-2 TaxID=2908646 RepID=UPI001F36A91F|nr:(deoxy)nucleoside triphosphate pyrophosphohydrolase [Vibrio sp. SS-MA-C1-2]UJF18869.1 (deoxy)nucleoside triphosphate pyrophosphohydrolase [Vibrio sp. SS-MA-C1-2]